MTKRILLINSDLAKNRGDRAIAEGNIALIKKYFPGAIITGISQHPERDKHWYGIEFLDMNFQSTSPFDLWRLCRFAAKQDVVLWGGGEILKDYTNKAALWYWVTKMSFVWLANRNLYGLYQGIGPTSALSSQRLITFIVEKTKLFIVRDQESYDKLARWDGDVSKVRVAADPAVLPAPVPISQELARKLKAEFNIDEAFLKNFICIGPRDWFHYKKGGVIPFKYAKHLPTIRPIQQNLQHDLYITQLKKAVHQLAEQHDTAILFVPMHLEENDAELCRDLRAALPDETKAIILDKDVLSPTELRSVIGQADAMIGFRLHSNIIGVSAGVPSLNIYYVDKGRVFFDQIGQSEFCLPIETVLEDNFSDIFMERFKVLKRDKLSIRREINDATSRQRSIVNQVFKELRSVYDKS